MKYCRMTGLVGFQTGKYRMDLLLSREMKCSATFNLIINKE